MEVKEFLLEHWLNPRDPYAKYNLGASCVKAFHVDELFDYLGLDVDEFLDQVRHMSLHYCYFDGMPRLREAISTWYEDVSPDEVMTVHGGTGANNLVMSELLQPGDNVVVFAPNYEQHFNYPESIAEVRRLACRRENGYLPDLDELASLVDDRTRMVIITNPNNPSGAYVRRQMLEPVCEIARSHDAYVLSDEIYRGLDEDYMASVVDVYEKGIVTCSTSKVFSMAGTRVGWVVCKDKPTYTRLFNRRSYDTVSDGVFDEMISAVALEHIDQILARSRSIVGESRAILDEWLATQPALHSDYRSYSTTALVNYDYPIENYDFCNGLYEKTGVLLCHGDCFDLPRTFRIGYGFGAPDHFAEALGVMGDYLKTL